MVVKYYHCNTLTLQIKAGRGPRVVFKRCACHVVYLFVSFIRSFILSIVVVGWVSLQKWTMCSRTGYKCQILHTDISGYGKYHVIRPPKFFDWYVNFLAFPIWLP